MAALTATLAACTGASVGDAISENIEEAAETAPVSTTTLSEAGAMGEAVSVERDRQVQTEEPNDDSPLPDAASASDLPTAASVEAAADTDASEVSDCEYPPRSWYSGSSPIGGYVIDVAPEWPFEGVVQLWPGGDWEPYWFVRYLEVGLGADGCLSVSEARQVPLPNEWAIDCIGKMAMAVHPDEGLEVGGPAGASDGSFFLPWGGEPVWRESPSEALLDEARSRTSNIEFSSSGDLLVLEYGTERESYEIRSPQWPQSPGWTVRARHDGPLVLVTAQPAHLECFSGVTWLSHAATGRVLACGGNTMATAYVSASGEQPDELVLPLPRQFDDYIECGLRLDLWQLAEAFRYWS